MSGRRVIAIFLIVASLAAALAFTLSWRLGMQGLEGRLDQSLILTRRAIESEIERFRYLPDVAAQDARIGAALASHDPAQIDAANAYLQSIAEASGAAQLFLLNRDGLAIAASNWNRPGSFVGNDYGFRPYFADAMAEGRGRYYAIGVTTGRPGYFLSSRVGQGADIGVMVVKVDLLPLQETWQSAGVRTAIADSDGVVFLSGAPDWLYRPLAALPADVLARLAQTRRYDGVDLAMATPLLPDGNAADAARLSLPDSAGHWLSGRQTGIEPDGWRVISAAPAREVLVTAIIWAVGAALVALAGTGVGMIQNQRRQLVALRLRQGALLEARVAERTEELGREIEARRQTEADLRALQEGLIHSEKMAALGRMSAAIVHEVSQPLAAMEATLAAAELHMKDGGSGKALPRIATARNHIRRMQRSIKHLKSFSRKEPDALSPVDLNRVIENALELVEPRARAVHVTPRFEVGPPAQVMAGAVRLEQVCLNLLLNALDAVEGREGGAVLVRAGLRDGQAWFSVADNGSGIAPDHLARVTEPFFSTKISGEGLGLGLAISQAIVEEFNGALSFASREGEGTEVTVTLPEAAPYKAAAE